MDIDVVKDSRWDLYQDSSDFLKGLANQIELHPNVSKDVEKRFNVIKKLILHSYFEYEFLDIASNHSLFTFELALKRRYEVIMGNKVKRKSLYKLIKWGAANNLFEDDESIVQSLRKLRNHEAHPEYYSLAGYANVEIIRRTVEMINDMHEDPLLRVERKERSKEINEDLTAFIENGAILEVESKRFIIFYYSLLFFDNRKGNDLYYFLAWPIFYPEFQNDHMDFCDPLVFKAEEVNFEGSYLTFFLTDGSEVYLKNIQKEVNQKKYEAFLKGFSSNRAAQEFINMRIGEKRISVMRENRD